MKHLYDKLQVIESKDKELSKTERLAAINRPLLSWYEDHARILPWRENREPYRVWISEIMLQQTRVEAVKPYFERFIGELPTVSHLANVPEERLMKLWEGLGYYNRAKNLQKAAVTAMDQYGGELPDSYEELLKLPGIGSYTAGAIASIAYGAAVPAVDGNVLRVVSRLLASYDDILKQSVKRQIEAELRKTMPKDRASDFNQGLIEIGAIVCVPNGTPRCDECPLYSLCLARKRDLWGQIPVKTPKKKRRLEDKTVFILEYEGQIALRKRADTGLLPSLYELPNTEGHLEENQVAEVLSLNPDWIAGIEVLSKAKHIFSHVEWHMTGYRVTLKEKIPDFYIIAEKTSLKDKYPLPNAFGAYTQLVK